MEEIDGWDQIRRGCQGEARRRLSEWVGGWDVYLQHALLAALGLFGGRLGPQGLGGAEELADAGLGFGPGGVVAGVGGWVGGSE